MSVRSLTESFSTRNVWVLSSKETWSYAVGHVLNDLCCACWFTYMLIFLTDIKGLSSANAGIVMACGQACDGFATPLIGVLSDKSKGFPSLGLGRRKLWYTLGTLLVFLCFSMVFVVDVPGLVFDGSSGSYSTDVLVYYAVAASCFNIGWAAVQVSHMALVPELSPWPSERLRLNSLRYAFTVLSSIMAYLLFLFFVSVLSPPTSTSTPTPPTPASVYQGVGAGCVVIGVLATAVFLTGVSETGGKRSGEGGGGDGDDMDELQQLLLPPATTGVGSYGSTSSRGGRGGVGSIAAAAVVAADAAGGGGGTTPLPVVSQPALSRRRTVAPTPSSPLATHTPPGTLLLRTQSSLGPRPMGGGGGGRRYGPRLLRSSFARPAEVWGAAATGVWGGGEAARLEREEEEEAARVVLAAEAYVGGGEAGVRAKRRMTSYLFVEPQDSSSSSKQLGWRDWLRHGPFYHVALIYMTARVVTCLSQVYIPLYLLHSVSLGSQALALVPLCMYIASFLMTTQQQQVDRALGRPMAFSLGALMCLLACVGFYLAPDPSGFDNTRTAAAAAAVPAANATHEGYGGGELNSVYKQLVEEGGGGGGVNWGVVGGQLLVYASAALLGMGGTGMMVGAATLQSDLVGDNVDSGAFVFGAHAFLDKTGKGGAVLLIQTLQQRLEGPGGECESDECKSFVRVVLSVVTGSAALAALLLMLFRQAFDSDKQQQQQQQDEEVGAGLEEVDVDVSSHDSALALEVVATSGSASRQE